MQTCTPTLSLDGCPTALIDSTNVINTSANRKQEMEMAGERDEDEEKEDLINSIRRIRNETIIVRGFGDDLTELTLLKRLDL